MPSKDKVCRTCKQHKTLSHFYKNKKGYFYGNCKSCMTKKSSVYYSKRSKEINKLRASYQKEWVAKNREVKRQYSRDWKRSNIEKKRRIDREVYARDPKKRLANGRNYYARKLKRSPKWLTMEMKLEIEKIYRECPPGYHVDHILPLKGKEVSGLHVPWNLQYLPAKENLSKSNKVA